MRIVDERQKRLFRLLSYPFDEGFQHRWLGVKVVIERPAGNLDFSQNILERHALIAFGIDQALRRIEDLVAFGGVFCFINSSCHCSQYLINRASIYYYNKYTPPSVPCQGDTVSSACDI